MRRFFRLVLTHSALGYSFSKCSRCFIVVAAAFFSSFYFIPSLYPEFLLILCLYVEFYSLRWWIGQSKFFRLMSWHCQNRCLAILLESARWTRISRYQSSSRQWKLCCLLCIYTKSPLCTVTPMLLLMLLLLHGAMLIVFSYVLLHVFRWCLRLARAMMYTPPPISTDLSLRKIKLIFMIRFVFPVRSHSLHLILFIYLHLPVLFLFLAFR